MKKILSLSLALLMVLSLCACGAGKSAATEESYISAPAAAAAPYPYEANGLASMSDSYEVAREESSVSGTKAASGASSSDAPAADPDKIIYTSDVTVETTAFEDSIEALTKLIEEKGGYVESSSINSANYSTIWSGGRYNRSANYTIRVPAKAFSELMSSLSSLGNIPSSNVYTENVTAQYYDTQARLNNYKAQEQRLVELLEKANTVSEVIEIENELTEVRYRIESLQTTLNSWDRKVSYSTVYLTLKEVQEYTPEKKISFGKQLASSFEDGIDILKDFLLGLVEILPVLIIVLIIIILLIKLFKKIFSRESVRERKEKKAARKAKKKETAPETSETDK